MEKFTLFIIEFVLLTVLAKAQEFSSSTDTLYFDTGKSVLTDENKTSVDSVLKTVNKNKIVLIAIQGFADARSTPEINLSVSKNRSEAIQIYLVSKEIPKSKILLVNWGKSLGVQSKDAEDRGNPADRKVMVKFITSSAWSGKSEDLFNQAMLNEMKSIFEMLKEYEKRDIWSRLKYQSWECFCKAFNKPINGKEYKEMIDYAKTMSKSKAFNKPINGKEYKEMISYAKTKVKSWKIKSHKEQLEEAQALENQMQKEYERIIAMETENTSPEKINTSWNKFIEDYIAGVPGSKKSLQLYEDAKKKNSYWAPIAREIVRKRKLKLEEMELIVKSLEERDGDETDIDERIMDWQKVVDAFEKDDLLRDLKNDNDIYKRAITDLEKWKKKKNKKNLADPDNATYERTPDEYSSSPFLSKIGISGTGLFPFNWFKDYAGIGYGALLRYEYGNDDYAVYLETGHLSFGAKKQSGVNYSYIVVPLSTGAKFNISSRIYSELAFSGNLQMKYNSSYYDYRFGAFAGIGYKLTDLDISARIQFIGIFETFNPAGFASLNIMYYFELL
ncbi:MAG: OmpA family protein [Ignavibacteria bacterium]